MTGHRSRRTARRSNAGAEPFAPNTAIRGFADVHNHQFANLGFGGLAFWGSPYGDLPRALPWCTPAHGAGGSDDILGKVVASAYGTRQVGHKVGGNRQFDGMMTSKMQSLHHAGADCTNCKRVTSND